MTTATRYALYQIPGILVCALVLALVWRATGWPPSWAVAATALWIVKDIAVYPLVRDAYERNPNEDGARLVGLRATVTEPLGPNGRVRVRGELWRATRVRESDDEERVPGGAIVRIERVEGLRLIVRPEPQRADLQGADKSRST